MSSLMDEASKFAESVRRPAPKHPDGWTPGVEWDGNIGRITAPTDNRQPDWRSLLTMWDFDPDEYEVVEPVQVRTWDAAVGNGEVRRMWYHRAAIRRRRAGAPDIDELIKRVARHRAPKPPETNGTGGYFLAANDWQLGKRGTQQTVDRIVAGIDASVARVKELRRIGRRIDVGILGGLGDIGESCDGHYAMQNFEVELDDREQRRLARHLITYAIERHAPLFERMVVPVVGGNHGEKRKDGQAYTTFADNTDVEVFESVAEALAHNPAAYGHVRFAIPNEQLTLTVQPVEDGPIVGLAHGHQAKRGGTTAQQKVATWWGGQAFGMRPVGDATILVTAHHHHFSIIENGPRTHFLAPTVDNGSQWWDETAGIPTVPALLSFHITPGGRGWSDAQLL